MTAVSCGICCESLNKSTRRPVVCNFCNAPACAACVQRYLLSVDDPECMSCKRPWTNDMVEACLTKVFVAGQLKKHRENVLLNRERSLLPATQLEIQRMRRIEEMREHIRQLERAVHHARREMRNFAYGVSAAPGEEPERRQFIKPCPAPDCRGFLSTAYKCGLCSVHVCPDCLEVKPRDVDHVCDPDAVASVRAIQQDSKPCPKCGAMIHRIFGCNQMFCTAPGCNTAFDWATLRILDAQRIHNPHYYEYMQRRRGGGPIGRELDDIPCGGMPGARTLSNAILSANGFSAAAIQANAFEQRQAKEAVLANYRELFAMHRFAMHVQDVEMHRFPPAPDMVNPASNRDLRMRYLSGTLSEERFKEVLQQREKQRRKNNAINQILATVANVASDMFRMLVLQKATAVAVQDAMDNMRALCSYANESLASVSRRFGCVVPLLGATWDTPLPTVKP